MSTLIERYQKLSTQIHHFANNSQYTAKVQLLAVSKGQPLTAIESLYAAGQRDFGENYLDEALPKLSALREQNITWHYLGRIQSRKCQTIAEHFTWVHSISRLKEARLLNQYREAQASPLQCCLQINIDEDSSKNGIAPDTCIELIDAIASLEHLKLRGLMTLPKQNQDAQSLRDSFAKMRTLFNRLKPALDEDFDTLSMGMSQDFEMAILEGSTLVRLGQALFGPRTTRE